MTATFTLIRRLAAQHRLFLSAVLVLLGGFEYLICAVVSTIDIAATFQQLMKDIPPFVREVIETQFFGGLSSASFLAFGWSHPIAQALGAALAVVLASRAVAGEIESGMMEVTLSQPLSRMGYLRAQVIVAVFFLGLLSLFGAAGTYLGEQVYRLHVLGASSLAAVAGNYFLLQCAWYGITLALSVAGREGGRVATTAFILALVSYLIQVIGKLWQSASFLLPYSVHTYYSPQAVLVDHFLSVKSVMVLAALSTAGISLAAWQFRKRDIP